MFLKLDVFNNKQMFAGPAGISLDWKTNQWTLNEDPYRAWTRITTAKSGAFEVKDWGVIWLWDQWRNIAIIWDAPRYAIDFFRRKGAARIYDPLDTGFKDGIMKWSIDMTATAKTTTQASKPLTAIRQKMLARISSLLPAPYLSANYDTLTTKLRKTSPGVTGTEGVYTSCGSMPGFVSGEIATMKGMKKEAYTNWMKKYSLNGTNRVRIKGLEFGCWIENDLKTPPKPGDIYALLEHGAHDKKKALISHVGVIEDATANPWKTMDLGQGTSGFDGKKVDRDYKKGEGELYGETNQGGGYRVLAGWVDLDKYFAL